MAEIRLVNGTVRWRGDDPRDALAAISALPENERKESGLVGMLGEELEALLPPSARREDSEAVREKKDRAREEKLSELRARKVKLIEEKPPAETLIVNETTGEVEQRLPGTGKIEVEDPDDPDGTIEITPTQLARRSVERAVDHMQSVESVKEPVDPDAASRVLVARIRAEAEEAGEELTTAEVLARAAKAAEEGGRVEAAGPAEVKVAGEPVRLSVEKA